VLAPAFNVSHNKVATVWLGRWCAGCAWGGPPKWFAGKMQSNDGRAWMLILQTPLVTVGVGRYN
jgi:hypothetical protein